MKKDYIPSNYGYYDCWKCLCEVCTRVGCPKDIRYMKPLAHCLHMRQRGCCPTVKCDWFHHKEKRRVFRVVRRHKLRDTILEMLDEVLSRLEKPPE